MNKYSYTIYVNDHVLHVIRCRPSAFRTFDYYQIGNWFNYPDPDGKVRTVKMVRSDGKVFEVQPKGSKAGAAVTALAGVGSYGKSHA